MRRLIAGVALVLTACGPPSGPGAADPVTPAPEAPPSPVAVPEAEQFPDAPCTADADCALLRQQDSCCDMCGARAVTKQGLAAFRRHCVGRRLRCPAIDCPFEPRRAACEQGRCITVPEAARAAAPTPPAGANTDCRLATPAERAAIQEAERFLTANGVLRGSPAPPPPAPAPPPRPHARVITLETLDVSRESLEPHAWGIVPSSQSPGTMLVVFRYDHDWLAQTSSEDRAVEAQMHAGQAVEVVPGPHATQEYHQDFLLSHVQHVCPPE